MPQWLESGCPTGIGDSVIVGCGVFPPAEGSSASVEAAKIFAMMLEAQGWDSERHRNDKSFYVDGGATADAEVSRITQKGFVDILPTWEAVQQRWPEATASKVALLLKEKPDGSIKSRLIIDLLRSGANGRVIVPERVVLPRLGDFVASIIDLMEADVGRWHGPVTDMYEICTVDFEDAFRTLHLEELDGGMMVFRTREGWAVFSRLCCGMAAAPLLWCRVSAAGCRLAQACFGPHELRIQCFVDDPAIAVRGCEPLRKWLLGAVMLVWTVLGFRLSFRLSWRRQEVPWIGASIRLDKRPHGVHGTELPGVLVTLLPSKYQELRSEVERLHQAKGMVHLSAVQRVAGQLSWASGMFPWLRGFNSCVWAALTSHKAEQLAVSGASTKARWSRKKRPTQLFFILRISQALRWIRLLLTGVITDSTGNTLKIQRWTSLGTRQCSMTWGVRTDASPYGWGGILFEDGRPKAWAAEAWDEQDLALFHAKRGDPAWQAEWELLAVLVAVDVWLPHLHGQGMCLLQTDAAAALHDAARLAGRTPAMSAIAAELALRLESAQVHVQPEHLSGTLNFECDALSRLSQGASIPKTLANVQRSEPRRRSPSFFWAWPRDLLQN